MQKENGFFVAEFILERSEGLLRMTLRSNRQEAQKMRTLRIPTLCVASIVFILSTAAGSSAGEEAVAVYDSSSSFLCFAKERITPLPETDQRPASDLWVRDLKTGDETLLVENMSIVDARLSPDRRFLAFLKAGGQLDIVSLPSLSPAVEPIEGVACDLAWSPSGSSLVTSKYEEDGVGTDLVLVRLPDGRVTRLTDRPGVDDRPVWSPDGERILFVSGRSGLASLWVMNPNGGNKAQVTNKGLRGGLGRAPEGFVPVPLRAKDVSWEESDRITYPGGDGILRLDLSLGTADRIERRK